MLQERSQKETVAKASASPFSPFKQFDWKAQEPGKCSKKA